MRGFRADHRLSDLVTLGADLHLSRGRDDLAGGSDLDRTGVAFGLGVLVNDGAPGWLAASVSAGYARVDGTRAFTMASGLGATILDQRFDGQTNARSFGARIEDSVTRRSASVSASATTIESPDTASTTTPTKLFPTREFGFGGGAT